MTTTTHTIKTPVFSQTRIRLIIIAILALYPLIGMGIDLIAPSLPAIGEDLHTSTIFSKNMITLYLLGVMSGTVLMGFISDAIGRRNLILYGLCIFIIGSILPPLLNIPFILLICRFIQGFGIAMFAVISRATLSDILSTEKLMHTATFMATMWGIGPIIGPLIGGYLQVYFNWQACFYFYTAMGIAGLLAAVLIIPETHFHRQPLHYPQLKINFISMLTHRSFIGCAIMMGISYSLIIVFNTLGPFIYQNILNYSASGFGKIAFYMGITFLIGTFPCRKLLKIMTPDKLIFYALILFTFTATISLIFALIETDHTQNIFISSLLMFFCCAILYPTAMAKGLSLSRHLAGTGAAILTLFNMSLTSLCAFLMSMINANISTIIFIYFGLMIIASGVYYFMLRGDEKI